MLTRISAASLSLALTSEAVKIEQYSEPAWLPYKYTNPELLPELIAASAITPAPEIVEEEGPILSKVFNLMGTSDIEQKALRSKLMTEGLRLKVGESQKVVLKQMTGTGYQWEVDQRRNRGIVKVADKVTAPLKASGFLGASAAYEVVVSGEKEGKGLLIINFKRPWETTIADRMIIRVNVEPGTFEEPEQVTVTPQGGLIIPDKTFEAPTVGGLITISPTLAAKPIEEVATPILGMQKPTLSLSEADPDLTIEPPAYLL